MPRLSLDDRFTHHPKIIELTRDQRWTWLELLSYTVRNGSPVIPAAIREVVPKATLPFLRRCEELRLLDRDSNGRLTVHDWAHYQGTLVERVSAYLDSHPAATLTEVQQAVAGRREAVAQAIRQTTGIGSQTVPERFPNGSRKVPDSSGTVATPHTKTVPSVSVSVSESDSEKTKSLSMSSIRAEHPPRAEAAA
jgi:hypothetical protein